MIEKRIDIGRDFASALGGRYRKLGKKSGEEFRDEMLEPEFLRSDLLIIDLDGIDTYMASFFEESFGGLVRKYGLAKVLPKVRFYSERRPFLIKKIETWMQEAERDRLASHG